MKLSAASRNNVSDSVMKVISCNCRGLPNNASKLHHRLCVLDILNNDDIDIVCLQETSFSKQDLGSLNTLDSDGHDTGAATVDYRDRLCRDHNPGGVAILWRTCLDMHAACLNLDTDWLTGIEINYNNQKYVILCVYMPYESHDHEDLSLEHIDTLKAITEDLNTTYIL